MAHKCLALLGSTEGPWVALYGKGQPHLRIVGLPEGATVLIQYKNSPMQEVFDGNGEYPLGLTAEWYRVHCRQPAHDTICELFMKAA